MIFDAETGERINVLPDRPAQTLGAWLREHPGAHTSAATAPAPTARRSARPSPKRYRSATGGTCAVREQTTRERRQRVHHLLDQGVGLLECPRRLDVALNIIKRYARTNKRTRDRRAPHHRPTQPVTTPQRFARLLLTRPENLRDKDTALLPELTEACPEMTEIARLTGEFAQLLTSAEGNDRQTHRLNHHGPRHRPAPPALRSGLGEAGCARRAGRRWWAPYSPPRCSQISSLAASRSDSPCSATW
ncbi:hypothetical protein GTY82_24825 [Streptomyces sp. SID5476]|uniref:IS transposase n=1 Tax=Streptomyces bottropensis ATCC 25435 TaxID=1054862 RepID=M3F657_9ACTN|nr:IS transposase [Streptomyces bottropensis ATCC 25435]MZD20412.1 hypothetical protein [Streptomyces sp. SID5476]